MTRKQAGIGGFAVIVMITLVIIFFSHPIVSSPQGEDANLRQACIITQKYAIQIGSAKATNEELFDFCISTLKHTLSDSAPDFKGHCEEIKSLSTDPVMHFLLALGDPLFAAMSDQDFNSYSKFMAEALKEECLKLGIRQA